jgi:hypothetical protein
MIAYIDRWILLAALAGGPATTWPVAAHAQSLDQLPLTGAYALPDALIPYSATSFVRWSCSRHWQNKETRSHS